MALNSVDPFQSVHLEKPLGGRYKLINHLAEGGFGQTFLAEDLHLPGHPRCVVKQLKPQVKDSESLQTARRLFDMEAKVLSQLGNHEQIPRLLAHFEDDQEFYLAQEFIEGETLTQELVEAQPWSEANVVALLQDILQVLTFVHQQNVIHRDIKPANLIRRRQDGKIVLIDFGAVKQVSTQLLNSKTGKIETIAIGTQGYIANELTLNQEAIREQDPPARGVGHQAKEAAKQQEREAKEASKKQEQEAKKAGGKLEKGKH